MKNGSWLVAPLFVLVAALYLFKPLYSVHLRAELKSALPQDWEELTTNGSFTTLVPHLLGHRYGDEAMYAARVKQILIHGLPYNPYWRDDRSLSSWTTDFLSHFLLAGVAWLCGGNLTWGWQAAGALLYGLWFLLFYGVFLWWSGARRVAVPLALFSVFFPDFYLWLLDVNFDPGVNAWRYASVFFQHRSLVLPAFHRLPTLFLTLFLMCLVFLGTWHLARKERFAPLPAVLLGLAYALLRYAHPFEYALAMASLAVFAAAVWLPGARGLSRKNVSLVFAVALLGAAAYAWIAWRNWGGQGTLDFAEKVYTRHFYLITLVHAAFAALGLRLALKETDAGRRAAWLLLACVQAAAFLCRNTQVVLGFYLQILHYIPMGSFFGTLMLFLLLAQTLARRGFWDAKLAATVSLFLGLWAFSNQKMAAEQTYRMCGLPRPLEEALAFADENLPVDALILSLAAETNLSVPIHTRAKVQAPAIGVNYSAPFSRKKFLTHVARLLKTCRADVERFIAERWLPYPQKDEARARLHKEQLYLQKVDLSGIEAGLWFFPYLSEWDQDKTPAEQDKLRALVREVEPLGKPFYIWVNEKDRRLFAQEPPSFGGRLIYRNRGVDIFEFKD